MQRLNNETRFRLLAMFECGRLQNGVVRRLIISRLIKMHIIRRFNVTDIFSNKLRPRAICVTSIRHDDYIRQRHLRSRTVTAYLINFIGRCKWRRTISRNTRKRLKYRRITLPFYRVNMTSSNGTKAMC